MKFTQTRDSQINWLFDVYSAVRLIKLGQVRYVGFNLTYVNVI